MKIHIVTTFEGCVLGAYSRQTRALAAAEQYRRDTGRTPIISEVEINEDVTQDESGTESV